jgi:hypothetical protein
VALIIVVSSNIFYLIKGLFRSSKFCVSFILSLCFRHANGSTLVICSEGNAGFYEIGIMVTPLEAGYSVLGWNHPGFGGSTVWYSSVLGFKIKC